jgi:hypothetical protein
LAEKVVSSQDLVTVVSLLCISAEDWCDVATQGTLAAWWRLKMSVNPVLLRPPVSTSVSYLILTVLKLYLSPTLSNFFILKAG